MADENKKVDDSWKNQIDKEKQQAQTNQTGYREPTFAVFVSSLAMQIMIAMGKIENPITGKSEANFEQARFLIDTLDIIKEKTRNNLDEKESNMLEDALYNLRLIYISAKK